MGGGEAMPRGTCARSNSYEENDPDIKRIRQEQDIANACSKTYSKGTYGKKLHIMDDEGNIIDIFESQVAVVEEYLANGYEYRPAYNKVHPDAKSRNCASNLFAKDYVKKYLDFRRKQIHDAQNIDAMRVLDEIAKIAFVGLGENENVQTKDKLKALELIQKQLGLQTTNKVIDADVNAGVTIVEDYGDSKDN